MTRVVVAVDDSAPGRVALLWADEFLRDAPEPVIAEVLTIWVPKEKEGVDGFAQLDNSGYPQEAEAMLRGLIEDISRPGVFKTAVGSGRTVDAILRVAEDCDLLVIGTRAAGPVRQALVGSMSQAVIGRATCPVAVIPENALDAEGRTLVAWDGGGGAIAALGWALKHRSRDKIDVLFVAITGDEESHRATMYDDIADVFSQEIADDLSLRICFGVPSEELANVGQNIAETVIGARECFGPDESIWGSVTSHVLSTTTRPVIVVSPQDRKLT